MLIAGGKPTPGHVVLMAFMFCIWNGYIQSISNSTIDYRLEQSQLDNLLTTIGKRNEY